MQDQPSVLTGAQQQVLVAALNQIPLFNTPSGRDLLLVDLSPTLAANLPRAAAQLADLEAIVDAAAQESAPETDGSPLVRVLDNALLVSRGSTIEDVLEDLRALLAGPTIPSYDVGQSRAAQLQTAVGMLLATIDEIGNPELLNKARELRSELQQDEPDVEHVVVLRRYFAALPTKARTAAADFFQTPVVQQLVSQAVQREFGRW